MTYSEIGTRINNSQKEWKQRRRSSIEKKLGIDEDVQFNVNDVVNHPSHYNASGIECIDAIKAATDGGYEYYLQGNIMKYIWRYRYKNGLEDLRKARWYLNELIEAKEADGN